MRYLIENETTVDGLRFRCVAFPYKDYLDPKPRRITVVVSLMLADSNTIVPGKSRCINDLPRNRASASATMEEMMREIAAEVGDASFVALRVRSESFEPGDNQ